MNVRKQNTDAQTKYFVAALMELATEAELRLFMGLEDGPRRNAFMADLCSRTTAYIAERDYPKFETAMDGVNFPAWLAGYEEEPDDGKAEHVMRDFKTALRQALVESGLPPHVISAQVTTVAEQMDHRRSIREMQGRKP